ncbi:hypothetical protein BJV78DRAFT_725977 [Lactifluus subvellereus]|nr:hypothetical protein BJV78DRAFT_725977 [Lactifluus subvellereus]
MKKPKSRHQYPDGTPRNPRNRDVIAAPGLHPGRVYARAYDRVRAGQQQAAPLTSAARAQAQNSVLLVHPHPRAPPHPLNFDGVQLLGANVLYQHTHALYLSALLLPPNRVVASCLSLRPTNLTRTSPSYHRTGPASVHDPDPELHAFLEDLEVELFPAAVNTDQLIGVAEFWWMKWCTCMLTADVCNSYSESM